MTEIDRTVDPCVEAEIKDHNAAMMRQMVAVGAIICLLLMVIGLHH
jgi:hypothetical protein